MTALLSKVFIVGAALVAAQTGWDGLTYKLSQGTVLTYGFDVQDKVEGLTIVGTVDVKVVGTSVPGGLVKVKTEADYEVCDSETGKSYTEDSSYGEYESDLKLRPQGPTGEKFEHALLMYAALGLPSTSSETLKLDGTNEVEVKSQLKPSGKGVVTISRQFTAKDGKVGVEQTYDPKLGRVTKAVAILTTEKGTRQLTIFKKEKSDD